MPVPDHNVTATSAVARVQVVLDQVSGAQVLDQVARSQVVVDQLAGSQLVDQVAGVQGWCIKWHKLR